MGRMRFWGSLCGLCLVSTKSPWIQAGQDDLEGSAVIVPYKVILGASEKENPKACCKDFALLAPLTTPEIYTQTKGGTDDEKGKLGLYGRAFSLWEKLIVRLAVQEGQKLTAYTDDDRKYRRFRTLKIAETLRQLGHHD